MPTDPVMPVDTTFVEVAATYWPILVVSFLVALVMTPVCRAFALRRGIVDRPDDFLKPHSRPIAYLGGVAIFLAWAMGLLYALLFFSPSDSGGVGVATGPVVSMPLMIGILLAGTAITLLGLADDLHVCSPKVKLAGNIAIAIGLLCVGLGDELILVLTERVGVSFADHERWLVLVYSLPLTVFIVVGGCNATNLIDGLDGLCGGVLGIISLGFLGLAIHLHVHSPWNPEDVQRVVLSLAMLGAALGFLPFNFRPATIFMGDAGSMLLGLNAAIVLLLFGESVSFRWMLASVVVFGLPIADMILTLARRWRGQRPLMQGDRSHFYDQLVDRGISVRGVVLISYGLSAWFVVMGSLPMFMRMRHFLVIYVLFAALLVYAAHRFRMVRVEHESNHDEPT